MSNCDMGNYAYAEAHKAAQHARELEGRVNELEAKIMELQALNEESRYPFTDKKWR